jgi:glycosyltransferase involved in cell wall biosynthesis
MRIVAVGHPTSLAANQETYAALVGEGVDVQVVVPEQLHHGLDGEPRSPDAHPGLEGRVHRTRIARSGSTHRQVHLTPPGRWLERLQPEVVLVDDERFSVPAAQWVQSARRRRIPIAVSAWENVDRPPPWPTRALRHTTLRAASGVFARTPAAASWARRWGARGPIRLAAPAVSVPAIATERDGTGTFTVGYVGRLVESNGIADLLAAADRLPAATRLLIAGDGPLRELVAAHRKVDLRMGLSHDEMASVYEAMDVLVLPSRTTRTSSEPPGRVLLEAMAHGRPVIASASGEVPWILSEARGGMMFPEGDVVTLSNLIVDVRSDPARWRELAARGRRDVTERFSPEATAAALLELAKDLATGAPFRRPVGAWSRRR